MPECMWGLRTLCHAFCSDWATIRSDWESVLRYTNCVTELYTHRMSLPLRIWGPIVALLCVGPVGQHGRRGGNEQAGAEEAQHGRRLPRPTDRLGRNVPDVTVRTKTPPVHQSALTSPESVCPAHRRHSESRRCRMSCTPGRPFADWRTALRVDCWPDHRTVQCMRRRATEKKTITFCFKH